MVSLLFSGLLVVFVWGRNCFRWNYGVNFLCR